MPRALTVQNAEINTASITIRTLQVEGRQVTMGVFRQLREVDIIDSDGPRLRGVGWGYVNYLVEGNYCYSGRTIHLVWQIGNELRRCLVYQTKDQPHFHFPDCKKMPDTAKEETIARYRAYAEQHPSEREHYTGIAEAYERQRGEWLAEQGRWLTKRAAAYEKHQEIIRWITARDALVAPLFDLPQLFIAV